MVSAGGLISDAVDALAVVGGILAGRFITRFIPAFQYSDIVFAIAGLVIAGWGLNKDHLLGYFVAGIGLALAIPVTNRVIAMASSSTASTTGGK